MARVDSLLSIVVGQGADELRLGTDREPRMFAAGAPRRLTVPSTSEETLRTLLGDTLDADRFAEMRARGRVEFAHEAGGLGSFRVTATARASGGFDVVFLGASARVAAGAPPAERSSSPPAPAQASERAVAPRPAALLTTAVERTEAADLASLLATAVERGATDVHLTEGHPPFVRVDGSLIALDVRIPDLRSLLGLDPAGEQRLASAGSLDLALDVPGAGRARVHAFTSADGLALAIRLLPGVAPRLASLRLPVSLDALIDEPHGLVLVGGATGAGKSTTLAALAQEALTRRSIVLTTLEDPIEFTLSPGPGSIVRRRQVGRDVRDFASGLRDALRQDPDVLLVGEMRDVDTIGLAMTAAETGHLVLSSIHCRSAASAVERIVDAYRPARDMHIRAQLAESLRAVVVQHLVPRARGTGRVPVVEVLRVNRAVAAMIREGKTAQIPTAIQSGKSEGMLSLERSLADRVLAGEIRMEDARAVANDLDSLAMFAGRASH
ncbi:MAG TPA: PilT/PilU family type 4a pilus ATPase [Polyangiaceae bacterium]|jgi:twitching motility protein PilT|nr:PilT/PilU family type 4a pilus ATPase [Polyangiaceae bacterium]